MIVFVCDVTFVSTTWFLGQFLAFSFIFYHVWLYKDWKEDVKIGN